MSRVAAPAARPPSVSDGVAVAVSDLPLAVLAPVHLGGPQGVGARLTVDGGRGVLQAGGIRHVAHDIERLQLERIGHAVGEAPSAVKSSSSSSCPRAFRHAPRTLTGSL